MKLMHLILIVVLGLLASIHCDWNTWGGGNNGIHSRPAFRSKPNSLWSYSSSSIIQGTILIDDTTGDVFIPNQGGGLIALRLNSTGLVQQYADPDGGSCYGAMTYHNSVLYVLNNQTCKVLAFNADTADILWTSQTVCNGKSTTNLSPMLWNANRDGFYLSTSTSLVSINAMDGSITWTVQLSGPDSQLAIPIWSAFDNTIVVRSQEWVYKIYTNGSIYWSYQYVSINEFPGQPAIDLKGNTYIADRIGPVTSSLFKFSSSGDVLFTTPFMGSWPMASTPVLVNEDNIFVSTSNGNILAFNTENGTFRTSLNIGDPNNYDLSAQMVLSTDGVLYAVSTSNGYLFAFDTANLFNLTILWKINSGLNVAGRGGVSVGPDGTIYIGGASGNSLYASIVAIGCDNQQILSSTGTCTCPAQTHPRGDTCLTCQPNEIDDEGFGCITCSAGSIPSSDGITCQMCAQGTFSNPGDAECTPCTSDPTNYQCPQNQQPNTTNAPNSIMNSDANNFVSYVPTLLAISLVIATMI